jgi:hypothetical protein
VRETSLNNYTNIRFHRVLGGGGLGYRKSGKILEEYDMGRTLHERGRWRFLKGFKLNPKISRSQPNRE